VDVRNNSHGGGNKPRGEAAAIDVFLHEPITEAEFSPDPTPYRLLLFEGRGAAMKNAQIYYQRLGRNPGLSLLTDGKIAETARRPVVELRLVKIAVFQHRAAANGVNTTTSTSSSRRPEPLPHLLARHRRRRTPGIRSIGRPDDRKTAGS